jgi:uncharacterized cupin superfamily protein
VRVRQCPGRPKVSVSRRNATEEPVRILMLSTLIVPDIVEYPDSSKFYTLSAKGELIFQTRYGEPAEYWDAES